jgi:EAL domain-containing protein (putative c-di-GMP-specific phosphodiesterase class I)
MEPSTTHEITHSFWISWLDILALAVAFAITCASIFIVVTSLRRLKRVSALLARARKVIPPESTSVESSELQKAVADGHLELLYQPQGSFGSMELTVAEALLRWRLPDGRYREPNDFLCVAEQSAIITDIDDWVLKRAIATAAKWHNGCWPNARVAVNVSPRQLLDDSFADRVGRLLDQAGLSPACLEIELTENVLQTTAPVIESLHKLRALGVSIALDDFGTGYSSLTSLEQLPLTRVKIDRSLVLSVDSSPRSASIVRAMITLCHGLGLQVTAEGVERPSQLARLLASSEVDVQGYLLARPLSEGDFEQFLIRHSGHMQELLLQSFEHLQTSQPDPTRTGRPARVAESSPSV